MTGFLAFRDRYADEQACIAALASVRWPDGFVCAACDGLASVGPVSVRRRPVFVALVGAAFVLIARQGHCTRSTSRVKGAGCSH